MGWWIFLLSLHKTNISVYKENLLYHKCDSEYYYAILFFNIFFYPKCPQSQNFYSKKLKVCVRNYKKRLLSTFLPNLSILNAVWCYYLYFWTKLKLPPPSFFGYFFCKFILFCSICCINMVLWCILYNTLYETLFGYFMIVGKYFGYLENVENLDLGFG